MSNIINVFKIYGDEYTAIQRSDNLFDLYRGITPLGFDLIEPIVYSLAERDIANRKTILENIDNSIRTYELEGDIVHVKDNKLIASSINWTTSASSLHHAKVNFEMRLKLEYGIDCKLDKYNIHLYGQSTK